MSTIPNVLPVPDPSPSPARARTRTRAASRARARSRVRVSGVCRARLAAGPQIVLDRLGRRSSSSSRSRSPTDGYSGAPSTHCRPVTPRPCTSSPPSWRSTRRSGWRRSSAPPSTGPRPGCTSRPCCAPTSSPRRWRVADPGGPTRRFSRGGTHPLPRRRRGRRDVHRRCRRRLRRARVHRAGRVRARQRRRPRRCGPAHTARRGCPCHPTLDRASRRTAAPTASPPQRSPATSATSWRRRRR